MHCTACQERSNKFRRSLAFYHFYVHMQCIIPQSRNAAVHALYRTSGTQQDSRQRGSLGMASALGPVLPPQSCFVDCNTSRHYAIDGGAASRRMIKAQRPSIDSILDNIFSPALLVNTSTTFAQPPWPQKPLAHDNSTAPDSAISILPSALASTCHQRP